MKIYFYQFADGTYLKGKRSSYTYDRVTDINKARKFSSKQGALIAGGKRTFPYKETWKCKIVLREGDAIIEKEVNL